jgi:serine/threonine protein kinase
MGEVWQAFDLKLQVDVALKALHSHTDEEARERMRREVRVAREVVSSHVCRVFDLVEVDGHELLSMEYVDGQTLQVSCPGRGPCPSPRHARWPRSSFQAWRRCTPRGSCTATSSPRT